MAVVGNIKNRPFMFARLIAITNGDCRTVPADCEVELNRFSSSEDTMSPATKIPRIYQTVRR